MPDPFGRRLRNLTSELIEGATDGAIKKRRPDTSNKIADATDSARNLLGSRVNSFDYTEGNANPSEYASGYVRGA
jgi:hypothetical protein